MGVSAAAPPFPNHRWTPQDVTALPSTSPRREESLRCGPSSSLPLGAANLPPARFGGEEPTPLLCRRGEEWRRGESIGERSEAW
uniref:Uncharacterized protein n=2 Tax=Oryza TaxID=4527 RepID=A0A0E0R8Z6_ORYRU